MKELRSHSFAVAMFVMVPRPISEFKCSARFVCRKLSRIVWPCPRARYFLSSLDSHMIIPTPSLSVLIFSARVQTMLKIGRTELGSPLNQQYLIVSHRKVDATRLTARPI